MAVVTRGFSGMTVFMIVRGSFADTIQSIAVISVQSFDRPFGTASRINGLSALIVVIGNGRNHPPDHLYGRKIGLRALETLVFGTLGGTFSLGGLLRQLLFLALFLLVMRLQKRLLLGHQRLPVLDGNPEIIGMYFRKRQETVTVAAEIHERGLQRGLDPRHFRQKNTAFKGFTVLAFVVVLDQLVPVTNRNPCFLNMGGVNKHTLCHFNLHPERKPAALQ